MKKQEQLVKEFSSLLDFVDTLKDLEDHVWTASIAEGKWSIRDIIAHMMLWDKYFLEEGIQNITEKKPLTVKHIDYDEFNKEAIEFAKQTDKEKIIDLTHYYRNEILQQISNLSEEEFFEEHTDGDGYSFTAYQYLVDFISHDTHHMTQIKSFLSQL